MWSRRTCRARAEVLVAAGASSHPSNGPALRGVGIYSVIPQPTDQIQNRGRNYSAAVVVAVIVSF